MKQSEALKVLAVVEAAWPSRVLPDETKALWAYELIGHDYETTLDAVHVCVARLPRPVSLAEIVAETKAQERRREPDFALPEPSGISFADWLEHHASPEEREKVRALGLSRLLVGEVRTPGDDPGVLPEHAASPTSSVGAGDKAGQGHGAGGISIGRAINAAALADEPKRPALTSPEERA